MSGGRGGDDADHDLGADPGGDDDELRGMRSVWLSMRDEEPSGQGMAALMIAARAQIAAQRPEPTWKRAWSALTELLRRPPVLALATVVVIAGTAALVTSHGGLGNEARPVLVPTAQLPPASAPEDKKELGGEEARGAAPVVAVAVAAPSALPPPKPARRTPSTQGPTKIAPLKPEPADDLRVTGAPAGGSLGSSLDSSRAEEAAEAPAAKAARSQREAPPPAPPTAEVRPAAQAAAHGTQAEPSLDQLLRECHAAVTRGDCPAVRTMVDLIRTRDDAFFRASVAPDASIAKCM